MKTFTGAFAARVAAQPGDVALRGGTDPDGLGLTWADYADQACRLAAAFRDLGLRRGDRVALMLRNRPEFHLADMAVLLAGGTPVSIYNSSPPDRIAYVLRHAQAGLAVVDGAFAERFAAARHEAPSLGAVVGVGGGGDHPLAGLLSSDPLDLETAAAEVTPEDLLTIIYTSGTTGDPKGVMLTHANLAFAVETYATVLGRSLQGLRQVSYLPMAHIAERLATHYFHIAEGSVVTTCDDLTALLPTMVAVQPEWFFSAPRLWEKLQAGIEATAAADPEQPAALAHARRLGWQVFLASRDGGGPSAALAREWEAARTEHVEPILRKVGLGSVLIALTGAAPTPRHTSEFFLSLGVPLSEVWGMSETSGLGTWSPHHIVPGTVGTPTPGIELRLGDDDEILVRGPCVFAGYLNEPGRTAQVLDPDGWLHTGDVGRFDTYGNLQIVDRIKDLIVPSSGHNVSPAQLEALLKQCPLVGQACVVGDGRPHVVALLVPDPDVARVWAARRGLDGASLAALALHPDFRAEIATFVEGINEQVPPAERIAAFEVIGEEWLPDTDVLTPTAKLKRRAVGQRYARLIDGLYQALRQTEHGGPRRVSTHYSAGMARRTENHDGETKSKPVATRRSPQEVRGLLLGSARELFAAQGYAGSSTREIATRAGVSEALLFRHFGTKAKLFERAVLDPINEFVQSYVDEWASRPVTDHTAEAVAHAFIEGFYRLLAEHRQLVMALITARAYESLPDLDDASPLGELMDRLEMVASREAEVRGFTFDTHVATRAVTGMVMAMALLDDWLFAPGKRRPSRQRIVNEMVAFMLHGLAHREAVAPPLAAGE